MPRRIWAIADTHLSFANPKPMHIFGDHWRDHPDKIMRNCHAVVEQNDLLLIPGDLSWALKRNDAAPDLAFLASLPGIKVLCKGNHDYWWDSDRLLNYRGLHDTPYITDDGLIGVAGTRGWPDPTPQMSDTELAQSAKITAREVARLTKRLEAIKDCQHKYALIHYPPIDQFLPTLQRFNIDCILYGHLHLGGADTPLPEDWHGHRALCVAADRLNFAPRLVATLP